METKEQDRERESDAGEHQKTEKEGKGERNREKTEQRCHVLPDRCEENGSESAGWAWAEWAAPADSPRAARLPPQAQGLCERMWVRVRAHTGEGLLGGCVCARTQVWGSQGRGTCVRAQVRGSQGRGTCVRAQVRGSQGRGACVCAGGGSARVGTPR